MSTASDISKDTRLLDLLETKFCSSVDSGRAFNRTHGAGNVVKAKFISVIRKEVGLASQFVRRKRGERHYYESQNIQKADRVDDSNQINWVSAIL